jgi:Domain of unknown function (DUF4189)
VVEHLALQRGLLVRQLAEVPTTGGLPLGSKPSPKCSAIPHLAALSGALCFGILFLSPAFAGYGAIAYDTAARKQGVAWDEATQDAANEVARRDCGADNCQVRFGVPPRMCAALATPNDGPAWGGAVRKSINDAAFAAIKNCQKHAKAKCIVREKNCTK